MSWDTVVRTRRQGLTRNLSLIPQTPIFEAVVTTVLRDVTTNGVYSLAYDTVSLGSYAFIEPNMTVWIGSTAGASDLGVLRVRGLPDSDSLFTAETAPAECRAEIGSHITVIDEFRIWRKQPVLIETPSLDFEEYLDYNIMYVDQNDELTPKANITGPLGVPITYAGWQDPGETFRTVQLSASTSFVRKKGSTLASITWDVKDGTYIVGDSHSTEITVTFPASGEFRYVKLSVEDNSGNVGIMRVPIWTHSSDYLPYRRFAPTKDERGDGYEMDFSVFGSIFLPVGRLVCYWEEPKFGASAIPDEYIDQYIGWVKGYTEGLTEGYYDISVTTMGPAGILDSLGAFGQTIQDTGAAATAWGEMEHILLQDLVMFVLDWYCTASEICCVSFPDDDSEIYGGSLLGNGSIFAQIKDVISAKLWEVACDSVGTLVFEKRYSYKTADERADVLPIMTLTTADWTFDQGFSVELTDHNISYVDASGNTFDRTLAETQRLKVYSSIAPGKTFSQGSETPSMPFQYLPLAGNPQIALETLLGHYYAAVTNPLPRIVIRLTKNMDVFEIASRRYVVLDELVTDTGIVFDNLKCEVLKVSVTHANSEADSSKTIVLTLSAATEGDRAGYVPVIEGGMPDDYPSSYPSEGGVFPVSDSLANTEHMLAVGDDGYMYRTDNWKSSYPNWRRLTVTSLTGTPLLFVIRAMVANAGWIITTTGIFYTSDFSDDTTVTLQHTFDEVSTYRSVDASFGVDGHVAVYSTYADGVYVTYTTNASTWSAEAIVGTAPVDNVSLQITWGTLVSSHTDTAGGYTWSVFTIDSEWDDDINIGSGGKIGWQWSDDACVDWEVTDVSGSSGGTQRTFSADCSDGSNDMWFGWPVGFTRQGTSGMVARESWTGRLNVWFREKFEESDTIPNAAPGAVVGSRNIGRAVTSAYDATGSAIYTDDDDFGASHSAGPSDLAGGLAVDVYFSFANESVVYHGLYDVSGRKVFRRTSGGAVEITPTYNTESYGPFKSRQQIHISPLDANKGVFVLGNDDESLAGVWVTVNGGASMRMIVTPVADSADGRYHRGAILGDGTDNIILYGTHGKIALVTGMGSYLYDKTGDLRENYPSVGEFVGITGIVV